MRNILLLGAGFSKNWGGLLASEFFADLIADREIRDDADIKELLWMHPSDFEAALAKLQTRCIADPATSAEPLRKLQGAIARIFGRINRMFADKNFYLLGEYERLDGNTRPEMFLKNFHEIYTLNQDLLLELKYLDQSSCMLGSWSGGYLPGLKPIGQPDDSKRFSGSTWVPEGSLDVPSSVQPYYKLHGSTNWDGDGMMIMGTGKVAAIQSNALLSAYHDAFTRTLQAGNTRLTVIGYSFADSHINEAVEVAVKEHGLKLFIVDPKWADIANRPNKMFREWFRFGVRSGSKVDILHLLRDESLDRQRLRDFLAGR